MIYVRLFLVTLVVVYIIDLSGFTESWKGSLSKWLGGRTIKSIKPFDCSLCMTWWTGLVCSLIWGDFTLPVIAYIAGLSFLAHPIGSLLNTIKDGFSAMVALIQKLIDRLWRAVEK